MTGDEMQVDPRLDRAWRAESTEEPPPALDDAVRAAARRAVKAGPRPAHSPFSGRWRVPLSVAAVVVVSITVTLLVADRRDYVPGDAVLPSAPAARSPEAPLGAAAPPAMPDAATAEPAPGFGEESASAAGDSAADTAPRARVESRQAADTSIPRESVAAREKIMPGAIAPDPPETLHETPSPAPALQGEAAPAAAAKSRDDAGDMESGAVAPPMEPATDKASDPVPAAERMEQRRAAPAGAPARSAAPGGVEVAASRTVAARQPQAWIDEIRALHAAGKPLQARRSLEEFRRRYPDYALPDDLTALLPGTPD